MCDLEIGRRCQVDHKILTQMRRSVPTEKAQIERRKVRRAGAVYEMDVPARAAADAASTAATLPAHRVGSVKPAWSAVSGTGPRGRCSSLATERSSAHSAAGKGNVVGDIAFLAWSNKWLI